MTDIAHDSPAAASGAAAPLVVNDVHAQLNPTKVLRCVRPRSVKEVCETLRKAASAGESVSIMGGGHAMGGQQFGTDTVLMDMRDMTDVRSLDAERGLVDVGAGIEWPQLIDWLEAHQQPGSQAWGIAQKQTGADRLTLGGALSANVHGRALSSPPIVADVEAFELVDASGTVRTCSRAADPELFRLVIGGYGLLGVITSVTLRLARRRKVERVVELADVADVMDRFAGRIADGFRYGDLQISTDTRGDDFLREGVFSCYRPTDDSATISPDQKHLSREDWVKLLYLGHVDKRRAVDTYKAYYLGTSGQVYWSDRHQLADYLDNYHALIDPHLPADQRGTEMITEIYVPRDRLTDFLEECRDDFRSHDENLIYTTIRLVERDGETFLPWAKDAYVGVIFNLHVTHTPTSQERASAAFRRLIDYGIRRSGSYYLTYHRFATPEQVLACYPQFVDFLRLKRKYDPEQLFQSDWYRHYCTLFGL